jgi:hypothetical protein
MVDRIGTDDAIERRFFKRQLAHAAGDNGGPLVHAGALEVGEQPLLRSLAVAEVTVEGFAKQVQSDECGVGPRLQEHDGGPAGARSQVQHFAGRGPEEIRGWHGGDGMDVHAQPDQQGSACGPEREGAEQNERPLGPLSAETEQPDGCRGGGQREMSIATFRRKNDFSSESCPLTRSVGSDEKPGGRPAGRSSDWFGGTSKNQLFRPANAVPMW